MRVFKLIVFIVTIAGLLASCQKEYFIKPPADLNTPISFTKDLQPILTESCAKSGCHDKSYPPKLLAGDSYTSLIDGGYIDTLKPKESKLMIRLNKDMPKGKLPQAEINKFEAWISQGAKDN